MKRMLLVSVGLCLAAALGAQPTMIYAPLQAGITYDGYQLSTDVDSTTAQQTGLGLTFDFSATTGMQSMVLTEEDPANTPHAASFPTATHATIIDFSGQFLYVYALLNTSGHEVLGQAGIFAETYTNTKTYYKFPFSYQDSFTDTAVSVQFGTEWETVVYEATGTLITPLHTYNEVIKLKRTDQDGDVEYHFVDPATNGVLYQVNGDGSSGIYFDLAAGALAPNAPTNLVATTQKSGANDILLTWDDNSTNEDGFKVERSPDGTSGWAEIADLAADVATYTDQGLTAGATYYYRVSAYNGVGASSFSNVANATTSGTTGISNRIDGGEAWSVSPTISMGTYQVQLGQADGHQVAISVYDLNGKRIQNQISQSAQLVVDLQQQVPGWYVIYVTKGEVMQHYKVFKY